MHDTQRERLSPVKNRGLQVSRHDSTSKIPRVVAPAHWGMNTHPSTGTNPSDETPNPKKKTAKKRKASKRPNSSNNSKVSAKAAKLIDELGELIDKSEKESWQIADRIVTIRDTHKVSDRAIAAMLGRWGKSVLNERYNVAKDFPKEKRTKGVPYNVYQQARKANNRKPKYLGGVRIRLTLAQIAKAIKDGKREPRDITRHINKITNERERRLMVKAAKEAPELENFHNRSWEEVVAELEDGSITAAVWADPPYGAYEREGDKEKPGAVGVSGAFLPNVSANQKHDDMVKTTQALFDLLPPKLAPNVPLYLIQHSNELPIDIVLYARSKGWKCHTPIAWHYKKTPSACYLGKPYAPVYVFILVFTFGEDSYLKNHVGGSNVNLILDIHTSNRVTIGQCARGEKNPYEHHVYQHPPELVTEVISHTVLPNTQAVLFEPFGCCGPASIAAVRYGLRYIYCEANEENYARGKLEINKKTGNGDWDGK